MTSMEKSPRSTKSPRKRYLGDLCALFAAAGSPAQLEQLDEVVVLAVDVADDHERLLQVEQVAFVLCWKRDY